MSENPNWIEIKRCPVWKVSGVIKCNSCDTKEMCWGTGINLPESDISNLKEVLAQVKDTDIAQASALFQKHGIDISYTLKKSGNGKTPFKHKIIHLTPDLIFGFVDNLLLVIGAAWGAVSFGVFGAIIGAAIGNALSDLVGGFFEGWAHEWIAKHNNKFGEHKDTKWKSGFGKFVGCVLCIPLVFILV